MEEEPIRKFSRSFKTLSSLFRSPLSLSLSHNALLGTMLIVLFQFELDRGENGTRCQWNRNDQLIVNQIFWFFWTKKKTNKPTRATCRLFQSFIWAPHSNKIFFISISELFDKASNTAALRGSISAFDSIRDRSKSTDFKMPIGVSFLFSLINYRICRI